MKQQARHLLWGMMLLAPLVPFNAGAQNTNTPKGTSNSKRLNAKEKYEEWTRLYRAAPASSAQKETNPIRLVITAIQGDDEDSEKSTPLPSFKLSHAGCVVFTDGRIDYFSEDFRGSKGRGGPTLSEVDLKRLDQLLAQAPDDGGRLPPPNRRVILQIPKTDHCRVRVYDRANAPAPMLEVFRLLRCVGSWTPEFKPVNQWKIGESGSEGTFAASPNGKVLVSATSDGPVKVWNPDTLAMVKELTGPQYGTQSLLFSPNGALLALQGVGSVHLIETKTWQTVHAIREANYAITGSQFTPDGKFLLLQGKANNQSGPSKLLIFDTQTGARLEALPSLPPDALTYFSAPGTTRAVYLSQDGALMLWDTRKRRAIAKLEEQTRIARIERVAFSPDRSLIAIVTAYKDATGYWGQYRLRLWQSKTGKLVHELRQNEQNGYKVIESLLWSADSRYVMATAKANRMFDERTIAVWNARSGRHRGTFINCTDSVNGLALFADGRLLAGSNEGFVRMWNAAAAFKEIKSFEASLTK